MFNIGPKKIKTWQSEMPHYLMNHEFCRIAQSEIRSIKVNIIKQAKVKTSLKN